MKPLALIPALALAATPALADDVWQQIDTNPGAYWVATAEGKQLEIRCNGGSLMMLLLGGSTPLPEAVQSEAELELVYQLAPTGLSRAADGSWLGPFDNALNGTFPSDPAFLDAFARADSLAILGPDATALVTLPMSGANWARFGFGEVCGL